MTPMAICVTRTAAVGSTGRSSALTPAIARAVAAAVSRIGASTSRCARHPILLLLGRSVAVLRRDDGRGGLLPNRVLLVLVTTQLVYSLAYDLRTVQGLLFGLVLAAASAAMVASSPTEGAPGQAEELREGRLAR